MERKRGIEERMAAHRNSHGHSLGEKEGAELTSMSNGSLQSVKAQKL